MEILKEVSVNIFASLLFWVGLGFSVNFFLGRRDKNKFYEFFGLGRKNKVEVYLSNLWLPTLANRPWKYAISGREFQTTKTMNALFGEAPFSIPEIVRGLVDSFWINKITLDIKVSPLNDKNYLPEGNTLIVIGSTLKNSARRCYLGQNSLKLKISGESKDPIIAKDNTSDNYLKNKAIILKGSHNSEEINPKSEDIQVAILEKITIKNEHKNTFTVFMCAGLRGYGSWAAAEYLKRHWRQLYKDFKNDDFAICLWFENIDNELSSDKLDYYREPKHSEPI